jgi:hypothetical protein
MLSRTQPSGQPRGNGKFASRIKLKLFLKKKKIERERERESIQERGIKKNLELAVRCSAIAFFRLRRQHVFAMLGSLCEKLIELTKKDLMKNMSWYTLF